MKPGSDFETPFEDSLAEFERAPLPAEWKDGLIGNAVSRASSDGVLKFSLMTKVTVGLLAACWVAIGVLQVMTPREGDRPQNPVAQVDELPVGSVPLLVEYIETRRSIDTNF